MHDEIRAEWIAKALARYETPLLRFATKLLRDGDRARDVVQETFLQLPARPRGRRGTPRRVVISSVSEPSVRSAPKGVTRGVDRTHQRRRPDTPDRDRAREGRVPHRPRVRHGQLQGRDDGEARRSRQRQLRVHRLRVRGSQGARQGGGRRSSPSRRTSSCSSSSTRRPSRAIG